MSWRARLEARLGTKIQGARAIAGGDINEAYRVDLADGRALFVKTRHDAPPDMYAAEADGLAWLRAGASSLQIPAVVARDERFLALELWERAARSPDYDEQLGRGLAELHRATPEGFGLARDNYIGSLPQHNAPLGDWVSFYRERRLRPFVEAASATLGARTVREFDRLYDRLPELVGAPEPPARLHGDLWAGNQHTAPNGGPALIDPAAYGGHREIDLAMMRLFGGYSARVFAAYAEAYPLQPGHADRIPLYQLFPLLVHVRLFGGGYAGSVRAALAKLL